MGMDGRNGRYPIPGHLYFFQNEDYPIISERNVSKYPNKLLFKVHTKSGKLDFTVRDCVVHFQHDTVQHHDLLNLQENKIVLQNMRNSEQAESSKHLEGHRCRKESEKER